MRRNPSGADRSAAGDFSFAETARIDGVDLGGDRRRGADLRLLARATVVPMITEEAASPLAAH